MGTMARWFLLLLTGCSLTLSGPDPNRPRNKPPACDTSKSLVALDGVMAATMGIVGVAAASSNNGSSAVVPALLSALFIGSAIHGNNVVNACHRELENYDQVMAARDIETPVRPPLAAPGMTAPQPAAPPFGPRPAVAPPPIPGPEEATPADASQPADEPEQPPPPPAQPRPPAAQPQRQPSGDRWSAFWREVP